MTPERLQGLRGDKRTQDKPMRVKSFRCLAQKSATGTFVIGTRMARMALRIWHTGDLRSGSRRRQRRRAVSAHLISRGCRETFRRLYFDGGGGE